MEEEKEGERGREEENRAECGFTSLYDMPDHALIQVCEGEAVFVSSVSE